MALLQGLNLNEHSPGGPGELFVQPGWPGCGHRCPILAALMPGTGVHRNRDRLASDRQLSHIQTKELTSLHPNP